MYTSLCVFVLQNDVVVAGGIAAGPLPQLFFAPGDGPGGAAHPAWKVAALKKAQFVGLAVCSKNSHGQTSQNTATGEAHSAWMKCSESDVCAAAGAFLGLGPYYPAGVSSTPPLHISNVAHPNAQCNCGRSKPPKCVPTQPMSNIIDIKYGVNVEQLQVCSDCRMDVSTLHA